MASSTKFFGLGFFDFGDPLGTDFAGQVEIDRWVFIDKQLFGLMSIFGNGVVEGWTVTAEESFVIGINEGFGNINFIAGRTTFPTTISELPASSVNYVYAKAKLRTTFTEEVEFVLSSSATRGETDPNFLLLAKVITGVASVESIDNSVRKEIGFLELIKAAIRTHKHRGGSLNPSKIDLASEVKGQLPSFRIADFDSEKVTTGTFDLARMPILDHQDLENVGLLSHVQLDSFVKTLESSNKEFFGEITLSNLLQLVIAAKLRYEDSDSAFFSGVAIDENMTNEIVVIPGITSDERIDFDNTTATVNTGENFIQGIPPTTGTSFFVNFDTALAWNNAHSRENLIVAGNTVTLAFDEDQQSTTSIVESFESATGTDDTLSDGGNDPFKKETITLVDKAEILADSNSTNLTEGFFAGKFSHEQSFRSQFVKEFSPAVNWIDFDSFILDIKCLSQIHGAVKLFFKDSNGNKTPDFTILSQDEVTENFEMRVIDLTTVTFRNDIASITIYSDDNVNPFVYFIDNIHIQKAILLPSEGTLKLRHSTSASVTFSTLTWETTELTGTEIAIRARAANGTVLLNRATFTDFLNSGDILNLQGTDIEIEITFTPDTNRLLAPILNSVRLLILTAAEIDGFSIDTQQEFLRGTIENIDLSNSIVSLDTPIFVDSFYFNLHNGVHQIHQETAGDGSLFIDSDPVAIFGKSAPVAPNQIFAAVEESGVAARVREGRLFGARSVRRQIDRGFIVADTYNDRILEFSEAGALLSGVGSINYEANSIFPIAASVDTRTGILYVVWSKKISFATVNVSKIVIQSSTQKVQLIRDFDKILGLTTSELSTVSAEGQIMPIFLSPQNTGLAELLPSTTSFMQVEGSVDEGVIPGGIDITSVFYKTVSTGLGIPCFIGKFAYIDGIFTPTWAEKRLNEGFVVGNATVAVKDYKFASDIQDSITKNTNISSIIEIDKNNNIVFGSDVMQFSPFVPGRVQEIDKSTLLIGGIKPGGVDGDLSNGLGFRDIVGTEAAKQAQKEDLNTILFGSSTAPHVGSVILFDKNLNTTIFRYESPEGIVVSDVDIDSLGQYVLAESSLDRSGRIIKIDTAGNVIFSTGEGLYSLINDIAVQVDGSIVVST